MTDPETPEETLKAKPARPWLRPVLAASALVLVAAAAGFGIGYLDRPGDSGPDLTREEAFALAREQTTSQVSRGMARRGFFAGKRSGRTHGIIAGGMAAESAVAVKFRQERAAAAQNEAAEAQSELAGMSGSPPPVPSPEELAGQ